MASLKRAAAPDIGEHRIQRTTAESIKGRAYSLPLSLRETLDREINSMLAVGVIEESAAAYASPVIMVKKNQMEAPESVLTMGNLTVSPSLILNPCQLRKKSLPSLLEIASF